MDFSNISSINNYIKTINMKNIWGQKANNPIKSEATDNPYSVSSGFGTDPKCTSINNKLDAGEELSQDELEYLREKYPDLYNKAVRLAKEKKAYGKALRQCKTKDDARILHMNKISQVMSGDQDGLAKMSMLTKVFTKFSLTKEFAKLAINQLELAEALKAEKEAKTVKEKSDISKEKNNENNVENIKETQESKPQDVGTEQDVQFAGKEEIVVDNPNLPSDTPNGVSDDMPKVETMPYDDKPDSVLESTEIIKAYNETYYFEPLSMDSENRFERRA